MRTAVLAVRLGELAGASAEELADTYYVALLHASGCTSNGHEAAQLFGDDIAHRAAFYLVDPTNPAEVLEFYRSNVGLGRPPEVRSKMIEDGDRRARRRGRARRSRRCARSRSGSPAGSACGPSIEEALEYVFARWDGQGVPGRRRRGDPAADAPPARGQGRLALPLRRGRREGARGHRATDRASAYEPAARRARGARTSTRCSPSSTRRGCGSTRSTSEPTPLVWLSGDRIDAAFGTIAAITGLKSPWLREHSTGVAELAEAAAWRMGLAGGRRHLRAARRARARPRPRRRLERDLGEARARSAFGEWERVRLHAHYTERAFAQSPALAPIGRLAGSHHERLDGSGYHRGMPRARRSTRRARILAAADCYVAMREARPYRPALDAPAAEAELLREARRGAARPRGRRRGARRRGPPRREAPARAAGRAHAARARGAPRPRPRRVEPGDRRRPRDLREDRRAPRPAHLREGRRPQPRRRDALGLRAGPRAQPHRAFARCARARRAQILASTSAPNSGAETRTGG